MNAMLATLSQVTGCTFAALTYTAKGTGEVARFRLLLGAHTSTLYEKDIAALEVLLPTLEGVELQAATELLASRRESLAVGIGNNSAYTNADTYVSLPNIPGVKIHKETGALHVTGLVEGKEVVTPGTYKVVKSSPKTIAKRAIEKTLASGRFRQFAFSNVARLAAKGNVLEIE